MRPLSRDGAILAVCLAAAFVAVAFQARRGWLSFADPAILTGYLQLTLLIGLALFAARKRLPMIPIGRASIWTTVHVTAGLMAAAVFWLHSGTVWPAGLYEQVLTALFYIVIATGILGYILETRLPARLTQSGNEIIYERIPGELARLRAAAQDIVLACVEKTGNDALAQHYCETLHWYFERPRFSLSHAVGSRRAQHWLHHNASTVERYLDDDGKHYQRQLYSLAQEKCSLDLQCAQQSLMKWWLFAHVPPAAVLMVFVIWHLVLVNVYAI